MLNVCKLGIRVSGERIYGLGWNNWMLLIVWLMIGMIFYFSYGKQHSRLSAPPRDMPDGISLPR